MKTIEKSYNGFDVLKLLCAVLVIGIHTEPFAGNWILDKCFAVLTRDAVPMFFMITSFLFFKKDVAFISSMDDVLSCFSGLLGKSTYDWNAPLHAIYSTFGGGYGHLWFLQATIIAVPLIYFLHKVIKSERVVLLICFCLYLFGMLFSSYYILIDDIGLFRTIHDSELLAFISVVRSGVFYAPMYVGLGFYIARSPRIFDKRFCIIGAIISFLLLAFESGIMLVLFKAKDPVMWFSMIPLAYFVFYFAKDVNLKDHKNFAILRKMTTMVYLCHMCFVMLLEDVITGVPLWLIVF